MNAALFADSVDDTFIHIGKAQNLTATGFELPALMLAKQCQSCRMPAEHTERQLAGRGGQVLLAERWGMLEEALDKVG